MMEAVRQYWALLLPLLVIQVVLFIAGLVDLIRREQSQVRGDVKWPWVIVLFINIIGPLVYFVFGRKD